MQEQLGLSIPGLHMIDEKAMAQLDDEAFLALRKAQALPVAYAQPVAAAGAPAGSSCTAESRQRGRTGEPRRAVRGRG
ncbi:hypothetical protein HIO72_12650 [Halomonas sp. PA5]|nr:hypothetical protein HIO72_12650 [Halomonas sp. PA5]